MSLLEKSNFALSFSDSTSEDYEKKVFTLLADPLVEEWLRGALRTPLTDCLPLEHKGFLKYEKSTPAQTFKFRGARLLFERLKMENVKDILATSTGNHGISLSVLSKQYGVSLTVCVPESTTMEKIEKIRANNAQVITFGKDLNETISLGKEYAIARKFRFISSTDEYLAIGHSTLLSEAKIQSPGIKKAYFPIGVGAGVSGQIISNLLSETQIEIIGVVHESHPSWGVSLEKGEPMMAACGYSLAPGLRVSKPEEHIFQFVKKYLKKIVVISDSDLIRAKKVFNSPMVVSNDLTSFVSIAGALKDGGLDEDVLVVFC